MFKISKNSKTKNPSGFDTERKYIWIYLVEQLLLVVLSYFFDMYIKLFVGLFPILFLTTLAFEKNRIKEFYELRHAKLLRKNITQNAITKEFEKDNFNEEVE